MIDKLVYQALTSPALQAQVGARVYPRGALGHNGVPAKPQVPYIMYGEGQAAAVTQHRETRFTTMQPYDVWVYDEPGSFARIKAILVLVNDTMLTLGGQTVTLDSGVVVRCTESKFSGYGQDAYDVIMNQNSKTATYSTVSSRRP